jgi:hypothetical protein
MEHIFPCYPISIFEYMKGKEFLARKPVEGSSGNISSSGKPNRIPDISREDRERQ